ncbi:MAG: tRNA uridine-5-carboxymethylaminomethyl(34) synthesis GTPase MnmE [Gammaproteobacteria bacterium]|nr:tRNA uridine-5-carboxymethylaminomethyl(34) synthesis GTPase MnmE [Gammaproteobacteria bacterium]
MVGKPEHADTIAAIATAPGQGAVGVVKISGPDSGSIVSALCRLKPGHREARYTAFYDAEGQVLDRGLALFFQGPDSHTGEDIAELHGHGGPVVMNLLLQRVLSLGARYARPGEFSERAFLNNKIDLLQAEAVADLISSASEQAALSAVRSMEGAFSFRLDELANKVIELRMFVEATLDFPEEEIDSIAQTELHERLADCRQCLADISARAETGRLLAEGLKIAIIGKPNAGKSSLLNRLAEVERAIVSPLPGTTRDTIEQQILIDGIPVGVIDTAGIRKAGDLIEEEGIRRARSAAGSADVVILIADATGDDIQNLQTIAADLGTEKKLLYAFNKIDLSGHEPGKPESTRVAREIYISAKTGAGIGELKREIKDIVAGSDFSENSFIAHTRHINVLRSAGKLLEQAAEQFQRTRAIELFAEDLTRLQRTIDEITGEYTSDDLLGEIFSRFCIGK